VISPGARRGPGRPARGHSRATPLASLRMRHLHTASSSPASRPSNRRRFGPRHPVGRERVACPGAKVARLQPLSQLACTSWRYDGLSVSPLLPATANDRGVLGGQMDDVLVDLLPVLGDYAQAKSSSGDRVVSDEGHLSPNEIRSVLLRALATSGSKRRQRLGESDHQSFWQLGECHSPWAARFA
jgi:hypothetical protein